MARGRAEELAKYIVKNKSTIRGAAAHFNMAKSTVHIDVSKKLKKQNFFLYLRVKKVLEKNFAEKHIRGGASTKKMWKEKSRTI